LTSGKATVRDLRRINRAAVLQRLFQDGPVNRLVLAQLTGLSSGSITNVTAALLEEGLVSEAGQEESDGGRPRALLQVNQNFGAVVGVELGETRVRVDAFDLGMNVVGAEEVLVHPQQHSPDVTLGHVVEAVDNLRQRLANEGWRLLGVGIAVPGMVGRHDGQLRVHAPNIGWHDVALDPVAERLGLPLFADNGAKALGQAEMWLGAAKGCRHAVVLLWGTGVGAAIFTNGALYEGATSSAGEWGHTAIVAGGKPCRCGAVGCIEAYVGGRALLAEWYRTDPAATPLPDPDSEDWLDRFIEAGRSSVLSSASLDSVAVSFGVGVANLVNLFNPEKVVIGGWVGVNLAPVLIDRIRQIVDSQALDYTASRVVIEVGRFGADAIALGASMLVIDEILSTGGTLRAVSPARRHRSQAGQPGRGEALSRRPPVRKGQVGGL
jgi:predicted NBD/HSP70 family sugar kinase